MFSTEHIRFWYLSLSFTLNIFQHGLVMISLAFIERFFLWLWLSTWLGICDFLFQFRNNISQALQKMDPSIVNLQGNSVFLLVSRNQLSFVATFVFREFLNFVQDEISDLCKFGYQSTCEKSFVYNFSSNFFSLENTLGWLFEWKRWKSDILNEKNIVIPRKHVWVTFLVV